METQDSLKENEVNLFSTAFSQPITNVSALNFAFDDQIFGDSSKNVKEDSFSNKTESINLDHQKTSLNPFSIHFFDENSTKFSGKVALIDESDLDDSEEDSSDDENLENCSRMMEITFNEPFEINLFSNDSKAINQPMTDLLSDKNDPSSDKTSPEPIKSQNLQQYFDIFDQAPHIENESSDSEYDSFYDEGHLTSTSDLDILNVPDDVVPHTPKSARREVKPDRTASAKKEKSNLSPMILPSPTRRGPSLPPPITFQGFQAPTSFHNLRRPGLFQGGFKKGNTRVRMTDEEINNFLTPVKKVQRASSHQEKVPQKPLTNCCVAAALNGNFRPMYTDFNNQKYEKPKLHWMSFPGLNLSPFDRPPTNTEEYLDKQKKKQDAGPNAVENEAIAINYCEICKSKFTDAVSHRASELHQQRAALCNWDVIENLFKDLNAQFVKELDEP